jgi:hypothetical protein
MAGVARQIVFICYLHSAVDQRATDRVDVTPLFDEGQAKVERRLGMEVPLGSLTCCRQHRNFMDTWLKP